MGFESLLGNARLKENLTAGIGSGREELGGIVKISGGKVSAQGGDQAAGIGGGQDGSGSDIQISGGTVTAVSSYSRPMLKALVL